MKKYALVVFVMAFVFLAACGNSNGEQNQTQADADKALLPLEVEILTAEDAFKPGEEGKIEIKVTEGEETVSDADEVLFEIWQHGKQEESEKIEGHNDGEGMYSLVYTFEKEGIYYVVPHVTARGKHNMPKKEFNVGNVKKPTDSEEQDNDHHHGHHGDSGHHHDENFSIHIVKPDILKAAENAVWHVHLAKDGKPFTDAAVRYEYWKTGEEKHTFIEAKESKDGEYTAEWKFESPGEYHVQVHVEKGELHEHKEESFQVE
ncbi:hypothetical protein DCC39_11840 [Pueribacillus theae]|uniref:YtkA-like domain-containing protein n=1 Tax=Pueribacillus theae TaxID=2171751 RepID=A0A2U1JZ59_9BACI|nr:FixH family protein [Pueribacillus theae]PWA10078.1 hypothetical protein DCC39_11840 [Pueribacillus theae]